MKKVFKLAAIAAIASVTLVACNNNNKPAEEEIDTTAIEQIAEDELFADPMDVVDTVVAVVEQQATAAKKTVKKAEKKIEKTAEPAKQQTAVEKKEVKDAMEQGAQTAPLKRR